MHESDCDVSSVNYRAGLCLPSVRPGTIAYLWVLYALTLAGYFGLSYMSKSNETLRKCIWEKTPNSVQWIEIVLGIMAWAVLGTYLGLAEGYDPVTLVLFFLSQLVYIGIILRESKKAQEGDPSKTRPPKLEILAALGMSAFFLFVHLFFTGTYAVLAIVVFQNALVNDLILYSLGRDNLLEVT